MHCQQWSGRCVLLSTCGRSHKKKNQYNWKYIDCFSLRKDHWSKTTVLTGWADQGVLLLNACLTVEKSKANAHKDRGWEKVTDAAIKGGTILIWRPSTLSEASLGRKVESTRWWCQAVLTLYRPYVKTIQYGFAVHKSKQQHGLCHHHRANSAFFPKLGQKGEEGFKNCRKFADKHCCASPCLRYFWDFLPAAKPSRSYRGSIFFCES